MKALLQISILQSVIVGTPEHRDVNTEKLFCLPNTKALLGKGGWEIRGVAVECSVALLIPNGLRQCLKEAALFSCSGLCLHLADAREVCHSLSVLVPAYMSMCNIDVI